MVAARRGAGSPVPALLALLLLPLPLRAALCPVAGVYLSMPPRGQALLYPLVYGLVLAERLVSSPFTVAAMAFLAARGRVELRRVASFMKPAVAASAVSVASISVVLNVAPEAVRGVALAGYALEIAGFAYASFNAAGAAVGAGAGLARLAAGAMVAVPSNIAAALASSVGGPVLLGCPLEGASPAAEALRASASVTAGWLAGRVARIAVAWLAARRLAG